ncbi:MAG: ABC transporter substrate-binding protein [bacterium]
MLVSADALTFDTWNSGDLTSLAVERALYDGLFYFDQTMTLRPLLATSWSVTPDGLVYTLNLRRGVRFADGTPFNAEAVKANLELVSNKDNAQQKYLLFHVIKNVSVVNDYTVKVTLSEPDSYLIDTLGMASSGIISPTALQKYGIKGIATHPVGAGAWMLKSWVRNGSIELVRNPYYWQPAATTFQNLIFRIVPNTSQELAMMKSGEAQFATISPANVAELQGSSSIRIVARPSIFVTWLVVNVLHSPLNNRNVRLALNYAIDRQTLIKTLYHGYATTMHSVMGSQVKYFKDVGTYPYDPAKARQLLAEAGYPNGFTVKITSLNDSFSQEVDTFVQQQFAQIGVTATIEPLEAGLFYAGEGKGPDESTQQLMYTGFSPSNGAAAWVLLGQFSRPGWKLFNHGFYDNATVNKVVDEGVASTQSSVIAKDFGEAQTIIFNEAPAVWLVLPENLWAESTHLQGAFYAPDTTLDVQWSKWR